MLQGLGLSSELACWGEDVLRRCRDDRLYRDWLGIAVTKAGAQIWAYCLMPNHVHAIETPKDEAGLRRAFGDLHRCTTGHVNARYCRTGHLWQAGFGSVAMDE